MDVRFEGLSLPVSDLDRSVAFYTALGFVSEIRAERFVLLRQGAGTLGLLELGESALNRDVAAGGGRLRPFVQIELSTDDLDGLYADLLARGVPVRTPPRDRGFERQMQLRDPDGFTVEFAEGSPRTQG